MYVETAPAVKPKLDEYTRAVVEKVNELRHKIFLPPIDDLPRGNHYWRGPNQCPVGQALGHDGLISWAQDDPVIVAWVARFDSGMYRQYCDHDHYCGE